MLTRREVILGAAAGAALLRTGALLAKASQPSTPVVFEMPAGACDCHTHIHGDPSQFPFFAGRVYTPETALPEEMAALHKALNIQRVVIVTPSVYGTDNSSTLYGMKARGPDARGIAVVGDTTKETELDDLGRAGFVGVRINLATAGIGDPSVARKRLQAAIERVRHRNWHIQIYADLPVIAAIKSDLANSPVPVVFDHFAGAQAELGTSQPGFNDLWDLVHSGKAYVKISGAYRASKLGPDYPDVAPLARALISANPDRIIWGTDWPHPNSTPSDISKVTPLYQIDDGRLLNQLQVWEPNAAIRRKILVDNPVQLYKF